MKKKKHANRGDETLSGKQTRNKMQKTKSDKENKIHNKMRVRKKDLSERKKGDKKRNKAQKNCEKHQDKQRKMKRLV